MRLDFETLRYGFYRSRYWRMSVQVLGETEMEQNLESE